MDAFAPFSSIHGHVHIFYGIQACCMLILRMALQKCQSRALLLYPTVRHYEGLYFKMAEMWEKKNIGITLQTSFHLAKNHSQPMVYLQRQILYIWLYAQDYPKCILSYKK